MRNYSCIVFDCRIFLCYVKIPRYAIYSVDGFRSFKHLHCLALGCSPLLICLPVRAALPCLPTSRCSVLFMFSPFLWCFFSNACPFLRQSVQKLCQTEVCSDVRDVVYVLAHRTFDVSICRDSVDAATAKRVIARQKLGVNVDLQTHRTLRQMSRCPSTATFSHYTTGS